MDAATPCIRALVQRCTTRIIRGATARADPQRSSYHLLQGKQDVSNQRPDHQYTISGTTRTHPLPTKAPLGSEKKSNLSISDFPNPNTTRFQTRPTKPAHEKKCGYVYMHHCLLPSDARRCDLIRVHPPQKEKKQIVIHIEVPPLDESKRALSEAVLLETTMPANTVRAQEV